MYRNKKELYELVRERIDERSFDMEIDKRVKGYGGLLSEDAAAHLLVDEMGVDLAVTGRIADMSQGDSVSLSVRVTDIGKIREFSRKNGSMGRVINLTIADDSGTCRLTLWDSDVEYVQTGKISTGSTIRIVNGYVKVTDFGVEVNIGRWGAFTVE